MAVNSTNNGLRMYMDHPSNMNSWKKLEKLAQADRHPHFSNSLPETENYQVTSEHITLDYSGQCINNEIMNALLQFADECKLKENIHALMAGNPINTTENRPALHTALRAPDDEILLVDEKNIIHEIAAVRHTMQDIASRIRNGKWLGYSGKPITDVVNLGIGGSMLGPFFCIDALSDWVTDKLGFHFVSDIDPNAFSRTTAKLNPETTLFIISSKSFTTQETLYNMEKALAWMNQKQPAPQHFIAVTANVKKADELGFTTILPIWDWVGGRYSFFSAINLISCIAIGFESFSEMLSGARSMDQHFRTTDFSKNLPVLLALFGIWNINFQNINNLLVMTYAQDLQYFVPYLQQLDMESNGKSINRQGRMVNYNTGPIIWGGLGNQAQHSYYQLLCQGTHKIAADLISTNTFSGEVINKMCLAHKEVLTKGVNDENDVHSYIQGEVPINHLSLTDCSPKSLGSLIALYEHKIFIQGVLWNINSFDQPGVESSKKILRQTDRVN